MANNKDTDIREALRRKYASTPMLSDDFTERLMQRVGEQEPRRKPRSLRLYSTILGGVAACAVFVLSLCNIYNDSDETTSHPVVAMRMEQHDCVPKSVEEKTVSSVIEETPIAKVEKRTSSNGVSRSAEKVNPVNNAKDVERVLRLLDEADEAFMQTTTQCAMDIDMASLSDGEQEDVDSETNIFI